LRVLFSIVTMAGIFGLLAYLNVYVCIYVTIITKEKEAISLRGNELGVGMENVGRSLQLCFD